MTTSFLGHSKMYAWTCFKPWFIVPPQIAVTIHIPRATDLYIETCWSWILVQWGHYWRPQGVSSAFWMCLSGERHTFQLPSTVHVHRYKLNCWNGLPSMREPRKHLLLLQPGKTQYFSTGILIYVHKCKTLRHAANIIWTRPATWLIYRR